VWYGSFFQFRRQSDSNPSPENEISPVKGKAIKIPHDLLAKRERPALLEFNLN
jgi:hypothetical protein